MGVKKSLENILEKGGDVIGSLAGAGSGYTYAETLLKMGEYSPVQVKGGLLACTIAGFFLGGAIGALYQEKKEKERERLYG